MGSLSRWGGGMIKYYDRLTGQGGIWCLHSIDYVQKTPRRELSPVMDIKFNTPSCLGYASLSISDPEKWGRLSAKARKMRKWVPWGIVYFIVAAICSNSRAIKELGHEERNSLHSYGQQVRYRERANQETRTLS